MATNKQKQILNEFLEVLQPTILGDKDIQKFIQDSNLSEEEARMVVLWFVSACLVSCIDPSKNEAASKIVSLSMATLKATEEELSKAGFDDVHDLLFEEYKANAKEWFEVITEADCFKPFLADRDGDNESSDDEGGEQGNQIPEFIDLGLKACLPILNFIFSREDDVSELTDRIKDENLRGWVLLLLATSVLAYHLDNCAKGKEEIPEFCPFSQNVKESAAYLVAMMKQNVEKMSQNVSNFDSLMKHLTEIVDDHYREFVKKMYKQLYKMIQENN